MEVALRSQGEANPCFGEVGEGSGAGGGGRGGGQEMGDRKVKIQEYGCRM